MTNQYIGVLPQHLSNDFNVCPVELTQFVERNAVSGTKARASPIDWEPANSEEPDCDTETPWYKGKLLYVP